MATSLEYCRGTDWRSAALRVRVHNPALLPDLMADLTERVDAIVTQTADDELEVSLLGSRTPEADAEELRARLHMWNDGAELLSEHGST
jgi:hypothetical protein